MTPIHHHAHKVVHHVRTHHKKYLVAGSVMAGVFAIMKVMVLFATSFAMFSSSHDVSFADDNPLNTVDTGVVLDDTGVVDMSGTEYDPNADLSLLVDSGEVITGTDSVNTGVLLDLIAYAVSQNLTGTVDTGTVSTGTTSTTGAVTTGTIQSVDTGTQYYERLLANQVVYCHTGDLILDQDLSGKTFSDIASFQWTYSGGCTITDELSFQLYDHNNHWIEISTIPSSNFGFSFDTNFLYTGGWYAVTGVNASGAIYTVDPGIYSGKASNFWTGYHIRVLNNSTKELLYASTGFTIDNQSSILSGMKFVYYTGGDLSGEVHLLFSANEELGDIDLTLSHGKQSSQSSSGLLYDIYVRGFGDGYSGSVGFTLNFADLWGNTGSVSGTGYLSFSGSSVSLTETGTSLLSQLRDQMNNFNTCKDSLSYKTVSFTVGGNALKLEMPNFKKSEVKKLISAFSSVVVQKLDSVDGLTQNQLDTITSTYNNFLVILKLVKDDDNSCEQNLSNYYMGQFSSALQNYGIDL